MNTGGAWPHWDEQGVLQLSSVEAKFSSFECMTQAFGGDIDGFVIISLVVDTVIKNNIKNTLYF